MKIKNLTILMASAALLFSGCWNPLGKESETDIAEEPVLPEPISRIVGITEESSYSAFVQAIWYPQPENLVTETNALLRKDGGSFIPIYYFEQIAEAGNYELKVTDPGSPAAAVVNFSIIPGPLSTGVFHTNVTRNGTPVQIEFEPGDYHGTQGAPIFAIWVEDLDGNLIHNIYVSQFPGSNIPRGRSFEKLRPTCLPYWLHKAGKDWGEGRYNTDPANHIPADIDAVTGATMKDGFEVYSAAVSDTAGSMVRILFEIDQAYDWGWYFTKEMEIEAAGYTNPDHAHVGEPSLVYAVEVDLDQPGLYELGGTELNVPPIGYSDFSAKTGELFTDFYHNGNPKFEYAPAMTKKITVRVLE